MIRVTSDAVRHDFALRTVATGAIRPCGHQHVGGFAALFGRVANAAIERLLGGGINLMLSVVEVGLRHPAINQDWFRNRR